VPFEINQPVKVYYFTEKNFNLGIVTVQTKYGDVRIYDREKTICDIFRYKDKIREDVVYESLKNYVGSKNAAYFKLRNYAKICRVSKIIDPSLKTLLG